MLIYLNETLHVVFFNQKEQFGRVRSMKMKNMKIRTTLIYIYTNMHVKRYYRGARIPAHYYMTRGIYFSLDVNVS